MDHTKMPWNAGRLFKSFETLKLDPEPEYYHNKVSIPWAVTYSPLTENGHCVSNEQIVSDLHNMVTVGIKSVRFFSVDCGVLDAFDQLGDRGDHLDVILGIHPYPVITDEDDTATKYELSQFIKSINLQLSEIAMWDRWDRIKILVVGSQGVQDERYSRSDLVKMIKYVRLHLESEPGFKGLITTVEPVQSWVSPTKYNAASIAEYKEFQQRTAPWQKPIEGIVGHNAVDDDFDISYIEDNDLCAVVDLVSLTVQPYFNSALYPDESGRLIERDVKFARYLCSDQFIGRAHRQDNDGDDTSINDTPPIAILEAGWPKNGQNNGNAVPGKNNQMLSINSMVNSFDPQTGNRVPVCLHSYQDEEWVENGLLKIEKTFGVGHLYQ